MVQRENTKYCHILHQSFKLFIQYLFNSLADCCTSRNVRVLKLLTEHEKYVSQLRGLNHVDSLDFVLEEY